jgi:hypothetical protein
MAVIVDDASCTWSSSEEKQPNLVLNHVNLCLSKGSLVAIIGEVKCTDLMMNYQLLVKHCELDGGRNRILTFCESFSSLFFLIK